MSRPVIARTIADIRELVAGHRTSGSTIGLVPTMGALHQGHLSLVRAAKDAGDVVVTSIFVNPLQFAPGEDLDAYPRTFDVDLDLLADLDVEMVFQPDAATFTPPDRLTTVHVDGMTARLEGRTRPTHFDGVTTIVAKLLGSVGPDHAYFGEKDFQQQAIIRRMVSDLSIPTKIVTCPVVREPDGLALSSRNRYLTPSHRRDALSLSQAIRELSDNWEQNADLGRSELMVKLNSASGIRVDYAEVVDPVTLEPVKGVQTGPVQVVVAAFVGDTRLLDTATLHGTDHSESRSD